MFKYYISVLWAVVGAVKGLAQVSKLAYLPIRPLAAPVVTTLGTAIDAVFQDSRGIYWFASNGEGLYRYDGEMVQHFTEKQGLCSNSIWNIQEDAHGHLWLATRDGICRFDGYQFRDYTDTIRRAPYVTFPILSPNMLFFNHLDGVCVFDGQRFTNFSIVPAGTQVDSFNWYKPYDVYGILIDRRQTVWFGTQEKGVCHYDGQAFSYIKGQNLDGPPVRSIFEDTNGTIWFGNNGAGLYAYKNSTLRNITEERQLGNAAFLQNRIATDKPGSLARVFAINQSDAGDLWFGTIDAGVWRLEGEKWTNYTAKDGLGGVAVSVIYKDKKGQLWFVADGTTVSHFDGEKFHPVTFKKP